MVSELCVDVLLEGGGTVVVLRVGGVVSPAVGEHPLHVGDKKPLVAVVVGLEPVRHRFQVHGILDVVVVVGHHLAVHRGLEGPRRLMILARVQDCLQIKVLKTAVNKTLFNVEL